LPRGLARQRGFLDFSVSELAIIFGLALVVLGPKKLPGLVGQIGRWAGRARVMARQFRDQLEMEVNTVKQEVDSVKHEVDSIKGSMENDAPAATATTTTTEPAATPAPQSFHEGAPTHFTLDGTQPAVAFSNPLDDDGDDTPVRRSAPEGVVPAFPSPATPAAHPEATAAISPPPDLADSPAPLAADPATGTASHTCAESSASSSGARPERTTQTRRRARKTSPRAP
jgi:sec-independent protein translocase protein TatB